jgi:DNA-binding NarL/FixJ family response regulator
MHSKVFNYNHNYWLLVEDDEDDQLIFRLAYKRAKIANELIIMNNGEEALEYIKATKKSPFVIISDINMPKMNGLEFLKEVKDDKMAQFKSIPFLIVSSSSSEAEIALTYRSGAQGYFSKSMSVEEQVELITNIQKYWSQCRHPAFHVEANIEQQPK